jgi:hypothetical protein
MEKQNSIIHARTPSMQQEKVEKDECNAIALSALGGTLLMKAVEMYPHFKTFLRVRPAIGGYRMSERFGEEAQRGCPAREFQAGLAARVIASRVPAAILSGIVCGSPNRRGLSAMRIGARTARSKGRDRRKGDGFLVDLFCLLMLFSKHWLAADKPGGHKSPTRRKP